jgi:hypothetical protein
MMSVVVPVCPGVTVTVAGLGVIWKSCTPRVAGDEVEAAKVVSPS